MKKPHLFSIFRLRKDVTGRNESVFIGTYDGAAAAREVVAERVRAGSIVRVVDHGNQNKPTLLGWVIGKR